jgi:hypothetical protein
MNEPIKKWETELNKTFSKEKFQMSKRYMKKSSPSLAIKEMQIKPTLRFCLNSYHQEHHHQQMLARVQGKSNPEILLVGM